MCSTSRVSTATLTFFSVGHVERGDEHALVGLVEGGERLLVERRGRVDHDVVERLAEGADDPRHQPRGDPLAGVGVRRCGEHHEGVLVAGEQAIEHLDVDVVLRADRLLDGVRREELHRDRDVAEGQVEVDQADLAGALLGQGEGQVDRDRGLADATLGREDRDHLADVHRAGGTTQGDEQLVGATDASVVATVSVWCTTSRAPACMAGAAARRRAPLARGSC